VRDGTSGLLFFLVALLAALAMARYYVLGVLQGESWPPAGRLWASSSSARWRCGPL
jgi:hypothetical protein